MLDKLKCGIYQFMQERYGSDEMNHGILSVAIILVILNLFLNNGILTLVVNATLIYALYRTLSKNIWVRQKENQLYLDKTRGMRQYITLIKNNFKDKEHRYFICPTCSKMVRVPRNRGQITIRCPQCNVKFDRKS